MVSLYYEQAHLFQSLFDNQSYEFLVISTKKSCNQHKLPSGYVGYDPHYPNSCRINYAMIF